MAALRQGRRSVVDFAIEILAASSKWNEAALVARFEKGLEDEIKDDMHAHELPEHLDELAELAILLDNRWDLRRRARSSTSLSFVDPVSAFSVSDAPDHSPPLEPTQLGRCRLSAEEKQKCLSKGL